MKRLSALLLVAAIVPLAAAQFGDPPGLTAASKRYRTYRLVENTPTFGLAKIRSLIKRYKLQNFGGDPLPDKVYNSLSTDEKFTYAMLHGEMEDQNCNGMPGILDEEHKIFGYVPGLFGDDAQWGDRQKKFLHQHRAEVIRLIRSTIHSSHRVGVNLKHTIMEIDAKEMIPDLVAEFNKDHKDNDLLTVMFQLMKDGKYQPFVASETYKKLYGDDSSYKNYIVSNAANQKLTCERAMAYYHSK